MIVLPTTSRATRSVLDVVAQATHPLPALAATPPATTMQAVVAALQQVSRPFLERNVLSLLRSGQPLVVDIDLTGRLVSPTSTDYPDAALGWTDDALPNGYQAAISSLSGLPTGRCY
jgi:hypothetical protein